MYGEEWEEPPPVEKPVSTVFYAYTQATDYDDYPRGSAVVVYIGTDKEKALEVLKNSKTYGKGHKTIEVWVNGEREYGHPERFRSEH